MTIADLASGAPTCAAPAPLPATQAGSVDGYSVPVRIKLTNGIMLAGYSAAADHYGQKVPYVDRLAGLTGWVNARIQIPSMKVLVDPSDVTFCDGATLSIVYMATAFTPPEWGNWDCSFEDCYSGVGTTQPDGSEFMPYPGTIQGPSASDDAYYYGGPDATPASRLDVRDLAVRAVSADVSGLSSDGALKLSVELKLGTTIAKGDGDPAWKFPIDISGTFSTEIKTPVIPEVPEEVPWVQGLGERPSHLPTKTLPGAVEGSTATIGSNSFHFDNTRLNALPVSPGRSLAASIAALIYGQDKYGTSILNDEPWGDNYNVWSSSVDAGDQPFPQFSPGIADISMDMTIDSIGLPHGIPAGYGWGS